MSKRQPDYFDPSENSHKEPRTIQDLYPELIDLLNQSYSMTQEETEVIHTSEFRSRFRIVMNRLVRVLKNILYEYERNTEFTPQLMQAIISQAKNLNINAVNK